jgi:hypothetical protein
MLAASCEGNLAGFRASRRRAKPFPAISTSELCELRVSVFSSLPSICSGGSSDLYSSPIHYPSDAASHTQLSIIFFRITSLTQSHPLTLIESNLLHSPTH